MRLALLIVGVIGTLVGLLWIAQGTGILRYPAGNFMVNQHPWAWRGVVVAAIGIACILVSRRASRQV